MGVIGRKPRSRDARWPIVTLALAIAFATPAAALAAFPGNDPDESPRANTPDDPDFDHCESDDEPPNDPGDACSYFDEQFGAFGFSPDSAQLAPPAAPHPQYADCPVPLPGTTSQLDAQGIAANTAADGMLEQCAQIAGVRADTAWKYFGKYDTSGPVTVGDPNVVVAILDTGIRWQDSELRTKVHLNSGELPLPQNGASTCATDDCNGDGVFNVVDFANDPRVS